jgi:CDGSH-type Zn-finger protein
MSERNKCGCGNTNDPNGYCDGSHMNLVKEEIKKTDKK